jgi:ribose 1,5-bisphosphokinase PhnN
VLHSHFLGKRRQGNNDRGNGTSYREREKEKTVYCLEDIYDVMRWRLRLRQRESLREREREGERQGERQRDRKGERKIMQLNYVSSTSLDQSFSSLSPSLSMPKKYNCQTYRQW